MATSDLKAYRSYIERDWFEKRSGKWRPVTYEYAGKAGHTYKSRLDRPSKPIKTVPAADGYRMPTNWYTRTAGVWRSGSRHGDMAVQATWDHFSEDQHHIIVERGTMCLRANGLRYASSLYTQNSINLLRMKIRNNLRDEIVDASMVVAELNSTVKTATTMLNRIGRSLQQFKKKNRKGFYYLLHGRLPGNQRPTDKFLRGLAGEYLQWKYGVMPSVYDLQGALKGLDMNEKGSLFSNPPLLVARAQDVIKATYKHAFQSGWHTPVMIPIDVNVTLKGRCDYSINGEALRGLNRYGLGLSSVATVAWDKTPFTFVLDMVVPVASLIKAWGSLQGVDIRSYCETIYREYKAQAGSSTLNASYRGKAIITWPSEVVIDFDRAAFTTVPIPLPAIKNPIKTGNIATVLALFTQLRSPDSETRPLSIEDKINKFSTKGRKR